MRTLMYVYTALQMACLVVSIIRFSRHKDEIYRRLEYSSEELAASILGNLALAYVVVFVLAPLPIAWYAKLGLWISASAIEMLSVYACTSLLKPDLSRFERVLRAYGWGIMV